MVRAGAADDAGRDFIGKLHPGGAFDPENAGGRGEQFKLSRGEFSPQDGPERVAGFLLKLLEVAADLRQFAGGDGRRQEDIDLGGGAGGGPGGPELEGGVELVLGAILADPLDIGKILQFIPACSVEAGDEGVLGHVTNELNILRLKREAPGGVEVAGKLDEKKSGSRGAGPMGGSRKDRGGRAAAGGDELVAQPDVFGLCLGSVRGE